MTGLNSGQVERLSRLKEEVDAGLEALLDDAEAAGVAKSWPWRAMS